MNKLNLFPKPAFIERMKQLLPNEKDFQDYLEILKHEPLRSIRCNTLKISPDELKKRLEEKNWKISQPWKNNPEVMIVKGKIKNQYVNKDRIDNKNDLNQNLNNQQQEISYIKNSPSILAKRENLGAVVGDVVDLEPGELGRSLEHLLGYYYIQELASMLPTIALDPREGELILDLAASPGSKTTQISAKMNNTGTIIANEVSLGRIKILASNIERCGCTNIIITRKDGVAFCERIKKYFPDFKFDKILVDAPCSGEGTLRSTPKTYQMWNPKTIQSLSRLQKSLVANAIDILKSDGVLVYSTCTHAPEENEEVVDFILEKFPEMKIEIINLPIKCREGITEWKEPDKIIEENIKTKKYNEDNIINNHPASKLKDFSSINNFPSGGWASDFVLESKSLSILVRDREMGEGGGKENFKRNEPIKIFSPEISKSCRIYPHDENTEGFFIAKFRKVK